MVEELIRALGSRQAAMYYCVHMLGWPPLDVNEMFSVVLDDPTDYTQKAKWDPKEHPRDKRGHFIRKGMRVAYRDPATGRAGFGYVDSTEFPDKTMVVDELTGHAPFVKYSDLRITDDHPDPIMRRMFERRNQVEDAREAVRAVEDDIHWYVRAHREEPEDETHDTEEWRKLNDALHDARNKLRDAKPTVDEMVAFVPHLQPLWDEYERAWDAGDEKLPPQFTGDNDTINDLSSEINMAFDSLGFRAQGNALDVSAVFNRKKEEDWMRYSWQWGMGIPDSINLERAVHALQLVPPNTHIHKKDPDTKTLSDVAWRTKSDKYIEVAKKVYEDTQRVLEKQGVDHVHLYRGISAHATLQQEGQYEDVYDPYSFESPDLRDLNLRPGPPIRQHATLESWTTEESDAWDFAQQGYAGYGGQRALVFEQDVPRERIFGLPALFGYLGVPIGYAGQDMGDVNEFVVLGGPELSNEPKHEAVYGQQVKAKKPYDPKLHPRDPHTGRFISVHMVSDFSAYGGPNPMWRSVAATFDKLITTKVNKLATDVGRKYGVQPQVNRVTLYSQDEAAKHSTEGVLAEYWDQGHEMRLVPEMAIGLMSLNAKPSQLPPGFPEENQRIDAVSDGTLGAFGFTHELFHSYNPWPGDLQGLWTDGEYNLEEALTTETSLHHMRDFVEAMAPTRNEDERSMQNLDLMYLAENTYPDERNALKTFVKKYLKGKDYDQVVNQLKFQVTPQERYNWLSQETGIDKATIEDHFRTHEYDALLPEDPRLADKPKLHRKRVPEVPRDGIRIVGGGYSNSWGTYEQAADDLLRLRAKGVTDAHATQDFAGRVPLTPEQQNYLVEVAAQRFHSNPELQVRYEDGIASREDELASRAFSTSVRPEEHDAIMQYQDNPRKMSDQQREALQGLIDRNTPVPRDEKVYRKLASDELKDVKPGDVVPEDRFMSTTFGPLYGIGIGDLDNGTMELTVPQGTHAYYNPYNFEEHELILGPSLLRIDDVQTGANGKPHIVATVVREPVNQAAPASTPAPLKLKLKDEDAAMEWFDQAPPNAAVGIMLHGTTKEFADQILRNGVDVTKGTGAFGDGFYTSDADLSQEVPDEWTAVVPIAIRFDKPATESDWERYNGDTAAMIRDGYDGILTNGSPDVWAIALRPGAARPFGEVYKPGEYLSGWYTIK